MMIGASLVLALVLALAPDPAALVTQLGSERVDEREAAARALEALGRKALPALEAAREHRDPDVRERAAGLWESIQKELMARPTSVRLDFPGRTPADVVAAIREQTGLALTLESMRNERLIHAREPEPLPFWRALDRLGLQGSRYNGDSLFAGRFPNLVLDDQEIDVPTAYGGPFRVELRGVHDHRELRLIQGPWTRIDQMDQRIGKPRGEPGRSERFYADLMFRVEPRMWFFQEGPPRATEAVDDLGQSLVPDAVDDTLFPFYANYGVVQHDTRLPLRYPEKPGLTIRRVRGTMPVVIEVRSPEPALVVPLADAPGKTFEAEDASFTILEVGQDDNGTHITITARLNLDRADLPDYHRSKAISTRLGDVLHRQVEFVDAKGNVLLSSGSGGWSPENHSRFVYSVQARFTPARPTHLRYYRMVRVRHEAAFAFEDIPMP